MFFPNYIFTIGLCICRPTLDTMASNSIISTAIVKIFVILKSDMTYDRRWPPAPLLHYFSFTLDLVPIQITLIRIKLVRIGYTLRPHMNRITFVCIPSH